MADFTLTSGPDTVVGGPADDTVYATAATLNAGDSLTGGAGTNVLALAGSGTFRIDQLSTFTGFERVTLDNATNSSAQLYLGSQPIEVDATGSLNIEVNSPSNWSGSDVINGDASNTWSTTYIAFFNNQGVYPPLPVTYDLTSNTFSHVNVYGNSDNITLLINNADTAGVQSFSAGGLGDKLVTAGSTLDLSHTTVSGFTVASTDALGTTFTVGDLGTALQIAGGSGHDTLIALGFTLTAAQRTEIFETSSIETITDQTGTYAAPAPSPGVVGLTPGNDTFVAPSSGSTVYATAATLNAGDSLTGGAGTDVLALVGSGTFRIDQLSTFTGFERVTLDNATNSSAQLYLGSQPIEVDATGSLNIEVNSPSNWSGSDVINGDASNTWSTTYIAFFNNQGVYPPLPVTYDLTSNTFSHVNVYGNSDNITLLINNADTAGVQSFSAGGLGDKLVTAGSTLDLSHTTVSGFTVASTDALGTTFTVGDLGTALQIAGGSGHDTLIALGFTLTAAQRTEIFETSSIETITDQTGTYAAPAPSPGVVGLTPGNDTFVAPSSGSTVYATAATLNAGDSLTGGAGTDVLALVGSGTFRIDQLSTFTGFERVTLDNATNSSAQLYLGSQPIEVDATGSLNIEVNSPSNWSGSDVINGDASNTWSTTYIAFFNNQGVYPPLPVTYDLTSNTFSHVNVYGNSDNITLLINNADTAGVQSFSAGGLGDKLVTAGSTLDLSHTTVSGFTVASTDALGTTFTVGDLGTALQIAGGSGHDTLIALGFTLTAAQRTEIFETSSIETITDQTGTYTVGNAAPTISGTVGGQTTNSETPVKPFAHATVGDANVGATDTLTITLGGAGGILADSTGFSSLTTIGAGVYKLTGTAPAITSELDALIFTPKAGAPNTSSTTTFTLSDQSSAGGAPAVEGTTSVIDIDPAVAPTISGTGSGLTTTSETPVKPFAHATIGDANAGATDTLTIALGGGGTLADGAGFNSLTTVGAGVYTLSGTAAAITGELDALVFTPNAGAPHTSATTTFMLSDQSSAGGAPTVDSTTSVIDGDPAVAPTITNPANGSTDTTTSEAPVKPFAHVTIGDANVGATDTLTITLGGVAGTVTGTGLSGGSGGVYALSGTAAAITSELDALVFTPNAGAPNTSSTTTFMLSDLSSAGGAPVVDTTTTVLDKHIVSNVVNDFNGDFLSDVLWRNANGDVDIWNSNGSGGFTGQDLGIVGNGWQIADTGDFNGDGHSDILWRNANGDVDIWNSNGSGGFTGQDLGIVGNSWQIAGTGDFNDDGHADILWRNANGDVDLWNSNGRGGFTGQDLGIVGNSWQIAGTGDFNGNGHDGILWRNANGDVDLWNSNGSGGFTGQDLGIVGNSWQIVGTGDFNGDGHADILWRNANGDVDLWNSNGSGGFTGQDLGIVGNSWQIVGTGDFHGDGHADILWRNANGDAYLWNSNGSGGFTGQDLGIVGNSWKIQSVA